MRCESMYIWRVEGYTRGFSKAILYSFNILFSNCFDHCSAIFTEKFINNLRNY